MEFNKIPVDGSTRFDDDIMNTIEPFDYEELENYNHAYLSGFLAEKYDVEEIESFKTASSRSINSARDEMKNDMGMGIKSVIKDKFSANKLLTKYVLLPVWMINVKYNNKFYIFAMNGQTGKMVGDLPIDWGAFWRYFAIIAGSIAAVIIIIGLLYNLL